MTVAPLRSGDVLRIRPAVVAPYMIPSARRAALMGFSSGASLLGAIATAPRPTPPISGLTAEVAALEALAGPEPKGPRLK